MKLETWNTVAKKFRTKTKKAYAPKSPKMYLASLVVCSQCGLKMSSRTQSEEYYCTNWDRHRTRDQLNECPCGRHGVKQSLIEQYLTQYLEETGKRLELLTRFSADHTTDRLAGRQESAWDEFCNGVDRLVRYLSTHHPEEYERLVREDAARLKSDNRECPRDDEKAGRTAAPVSAGTLVKKYGKRLQDAAARALQADAPPPDMFVSELLKSYRANFDPTGLKAEIARLDDEHTTLTRRYADLPTPRAKEKAAAELAALENRIGELEKQSEDASAAVLSQWRELQSLSVAVTKATRDMQGGEGEHAMRQRAEALRAVMSRIECEFVVSAKRDLVTIKQGEYKGKRMGKGGPGQARSKLVAIHFYPLVGDAKILPVDCPDTGNARYHLTGLA